MTDEHILSYPRMPYAQAADQTSTESTPGQSIASPHVTNIGWNAAETNVKMRGNRSACRSVYLAEPVKHRFLFEEIMPLY